MRFSGGGFFALIATGSHKSMPRRGARRSPRFFSAVPKEIGIDEAGRGPLAGPVVCAACYVPEGVSVQGVMDSKKIKTEEAREEVYETILSTPGLRFAVAKCEPALIDDANILQATLATMRLCGYELCRKLLLLDEGADDAAILECETIDLSMYANNLPGGEGLVVSIDGNHDPFKSVDWIVSKAIIGGDDSVQSISAASVIAKVTRDRIMNQIHEKHPEYEFIKHKGYGTLFHRTTIIEQGWIPGVHRKSFDPVKSMIAAENGDDEEKDKKKRRKVKQ